MICVDLPPLGLTDTGEFSCTGCTCAVVSELQSGMSLSSSNLRDVGDLGVC